MSEKFKIENRLHIKWLNYIMPTEIRKKSDKSRPISCATVKIATAMDYYCHNFNVTKVVHSHSICLLLGYHNDVTAAS